MDIPTSDYKYGSIIFKEELKSISSSKIRNLVSYVLDNKVNQLFYSVPSSSTGKHHPKYALGEGGLVRHTKAMFWVCREILSLEIMENEFTDRERDCIYSAILLHDTCKCGIKDWESGTKFEHPLYVRYLLDKDDFNDSPYELELKGVWEDIVNLVETHMGQFNASRYSKVVLPIPQSKAQKLVHIIDFLASRRSMSLDIFDDE